MVKMHQSTRSPRLNKVKSRNNQLPIPYNAANYFLSTPNVSSPGQLQVNSKYTNNIGNINDVSVVQFHRPSNFQIKITNEEVNNFQTRKHHQQQFIFTSPQYRKHQNLNLQQKCHFNHSLQRKTNKDHNNPDNGLSNSVQIQKNVGCSKDLSSSDKNLNEIQYQQNEKDVKVNNMNTVNNKVLECRPSSCSQKLQSKCRKIQLKKCNIDENKNDTSTSDNPLHGQLKKVPENINLTNITNKNNDLCVVAEESEIDGEQDVDKVDNSSNIQSDVVQFDDINDKSIKNAREKTPMCLINDLARFNKISFQYRLTSENGPAHCKRFTVTLKLGDEEYTAEGFKIKKAQHLAAKEAIEKTKYKHPTPKVTRRIDDSNVTKSNITPTVELNALAMKLGQQTYYIFDPRHTTLQENIFTQNDISKTNYKTTFQPLEYSKTIQQSEKIDKCVAKFHPNSINLSKQIPATNSKGPLLSKYQIRFQHSVSNVPYPKSNYLASTYFPVTSPCKITLIVGTKKFIGVGRTLQQAKHNAAANALEVLKEQINSAETESHNECLEDTDNKSPISLVFEIGIKRNLPVDFKVLREEGPAHMRTFITACIVGDIITEGEGTGKKISKKRAAQKMLEELNKLPPITPVSSPVKRVKLKNAPKKSVGVRPKNLIECREETDRSWNKNKKLTTETDSVNPVTKLLEWHQNKKEKDPTFKLINELGKENSRRRQFVMEISSNDIVARGVGHSKKMAKRDAAQNFLIAVSSGVKVSSTSDGSCLSKKFTDGENSSLTSLSETFPDIHNRDEVANHTKNNAETCRMLENERKSNCNSISSDHENVNSSIGVAALKDSCRLSTPNTSSKGQNLFMKDQLLYLAKLLGFEVDFSDYPKGNHNEFLTIVMLSTNPPQICHGVGINAKESQEDAAKNALKILSEMGLNNAVKK
ncbi:maternal effect protein staufen isoform X3 [Lucilia cuprina]|uniref:maternal effect protein staufen isoform X3 n=1 Tax=Lucilia cuprina TaxID=7375 RepID=UPI001F06EDDD|nr:maternal effect protein staufen isoform X3 [Lucilia cuprina]